MLTVVVATLLLTAGCSGVLSGPDGSPTPTASAVQESTEHSLTPANGTDLRRVSVPGNGSRTVSGELDGSDPTNGTTVYEPVELTGEPGTHLNVTMKTGGGLPAMQLVHPNGTVVSRTSSSGLGTTRLTEITLPDRGNYTVEATSVDSNTTFEYELTVKEYDAGYFAGPRSTWNETERYLQFGREFALMADKTTDRAQVSSRIHGWILHANASEDYLVIGYQMDIENLTRRQKRDTNKLIPSTYSKIDFRYRNLTSKPARVENESWVPEVIYFRALNSQGELSQTNFLTVEWARDYAKTGNWRRYRSNYLSTSRGGPGSPSYEPGGDASTNESKFPRETYDDYTFPDGTTLEERYYNETTESD